MPSSKTVVSLATSALVCVVPFAASAAVADASASLEGEEAHGYAEVRFSALGVGPLAGQSGVSYGGALEGSVGIGFRAFDVGFVSRFGSLAGHETTPSLRYFACGPELAVRRTFGGLTLRTGLVPTYAVTTDGQTPHGRLGLDGLVQVLFSLDEQSHPAWRAGLGLRAGRWVGTAGEGAGTTVGVDLIVRSWW